MHVPADHLRGAAAEVCAELRIDPMAEVKLTARTSGRTVRSSLPISALIAAGIRAETERLCNEIIRR